MGSTARPRMPGAPPSGGSVDENIVRSSPLFAALDEDGKQAVLASMKQEDYHRSAIIFREGDPGDRLFIIGSGKVKVGHASGDGRENLLAVLGPGETIGELALFDPAPRNATATVVAESTLYSPSVPRCVDPCWPPSPAACARPMSPLRTWSSPTSPAAWPRTSSISRSASAARPMTV